MHENSRFLHCRTAHRIARLQIERGCLHIRDTGIQQRETSLGEQTEALNKAAASKGFDDSADGAVRSQQPVRAGKSDDPRR